jgi:hypothetical protein
MKRLAKEWQAEVAWRQEHGGDIKEAVQNARFYDAEAYTAEQLCRRNPCGGHRRRNPDYSKIRGFEPWMAVPRMGEQGFVYPRRNPHGRRSGRITLQAGDIGGTYEIIDNDSGESLLIQTDWDFPGVASTFGWVPCRRCRTTDGTVDCAHKTATQMIHEAADFLDRHVDKQVEDPGYFEQNPSPAWHEGKMREHGKAYSQHMNEGAYETAEYERGHKDAHTESYRVGMRYDRNPRGGHRRRNPGDLTAWAKEILSNDEASTDEELLALFVSEGMSGQQARAWVAQRQKYLAGVIDLPGGGERSFRDYGKSRQNSRRRNPCGGHRRRNPDYSGIKGFEPWMAENPRFTQAVDKYMEFHGTMPKSISKHDMPGMGNPQDVQFMVQMGKAMDVTYKPTNKESSKFGSAYVHEYGEDLGREPKDNELPFAACTPHGKQIVHFGGRFEVKDWVRK